MALLGMAAAELGFFLRHHPRYHLHGLARGLRRLTADAREVCLAAENATWSAVADS
ncbi:hypothetical protein [Nonomuraea jabiensis]|uniref:hypothetical protein n=1 Tax=Nonomuraea jabiensis TaxID=882448 RepID=UPI00367CDC95